MTQFSGRALATALSGVVALSGLAFTAQAQTVPATRAIVRDTTIGLPPKQPNAVVRPAGPVMVPGIVTPALPPDVPLPVQTPTPPPTRISDPDAPVAARVVLEPDAPMNLAEPAPAVGRPSAVPVNVSTPPAGSTARCKDGSYVAGVVSASSCVDKGGLSVILPSPRQAPPTPRP